MSQSKPKDDSLPVEDRTASCLKLVNSLPEWKVYLLAQEATKIGITLIHGNSIGSILVNPKGMYSHLDEAIDERKGTGLPTNKSFQYLFELVSEPENAIERLLLYSLSHLNEGNLQSHTPIRLVVPMTVRYETVCRIPFLIESIKWEGVLGIRLSIDKEPGDFSWIELEGLTAKVLWNKLVSILDNVCFKYTYSTRPFPWDEIRATPIGHEKEFEKSYDCCAFMGTAYQLIPTNRLMDLRDIIRPYIEKLIRDDPDKFSYEYPCKWYAIIKESDGEKHYTDSDEEFYSEEDAINAGVGRAEELGLAQFEVTAATCDDDDDDPNFEAWVGDTVENELSDPIGILIRTFIENQNSAIIEQVEPICPICLRPKSTCICGEDSMPFWH